MGSEFIQIGKLSKTFGTKGGLKYDLAENYSDLLEINQYIFLELKGSRVPFLVTAIDNIAIYLQWISNPEQAQELVNSPIFLPTEQVPKELLNQESSTLIGYVIYDQNDHLVGEVVHIEEYPSQVMLHVKTKQKEILIPFHPDHIVSRENNKLVIQIPEGLLDL